MPGAVIAVFIAGKILVYWVSWSLFSFWPLTVIRSMLPAAVLALVSEESNANNARKPAVLADAPKS